MYMKPSELSVPSSISPLDSMPVGALISLYLVILVFWNLTPQSFLTHCVSFDYLTTSVWALISQIKIDCFNPDQ